MQEHVRYLTYTLLEELPHGSFLRHGGVSPTPFDSLNFSITPGDDPKHVQKNKELACKAVGLSTLCSLRQIHGDVIHEAQPGRQFVGDGLITNQPGLGLFVMHADCQGALFYDPVKKAIAAVHCGWRGSVLNIYQKTIDKMKHHYNCDPSNIRVAISPSLGPQAAEFIHYRQELPEVFWKHQVKETYFDFWDISKMQLKAAGVLEKHLEIAGICTYSNPKDYFSYRRKKKSGRNGSMIALPVA